MPAKKGGNNKGNTRSLFTVKGSTKSGNNNKGKAIGIIKGNKNK